MDCSFIFVSYFYDFLFIDLCVIQYFVDYE